MTQPYAAAKASLLDRETGKVTELMLYPLIRLELIELADEGLRTVQEFKAAIGNKWEEV